MYQSSLPIGIDCRDIDCRLALEFWGPEFVHDDSTALNTVAFCELVPDLAGTATLFTSPYSGLIYFGDLCISARYRGHWAQQTIIAHEIGHLLGLAEDTDGCQSIMADASTRTIDQCSIDARDREELLHGHL